MGSDEDVTKNNAFRKYFCVQTSPRRWQRRASGMSNPRTSTCEHVCTRVRVSKAWKRAQHACMYPARSSVDTFSCNFCQHKAASGIIDKKKARHPVGTDEVEWTNRKGFNTSTVDLDDIYSPAQNCFGDGGLDGGQSLCLYSLVEVGPMSRNQPRVDLSTSQGHRK